MSLPPPRKMGLTSIVVVGLFTVFMLLLAVRRDRVLAPGQTIQFDDFFFTLRDVKRSSATASGGDGASVPSVEYIARLTVDNRAVRVPFRFGDDSVALVDQREGRRFFVDAKAQRAHEESTGSKHPDPLVLKAGESATKDYIFIVPADVVAPRMRIAPGGWTGLIIDRLLTGSKEFQLP